RFNFDLETSQPDIVHFLWPEELTDWKRPSREQLETIIARFDRWAQRARIIVTINNLYPHRYDKDASFHRLFEALYQRAQVLHHFSQTSKDSVCKEFPSVANQRHLVRLGFNYDRLLPDHRDRAASRLKFGLSPAENVYLAFGSLRTWEEVQVLAQGFERARDPKKRLLIASQYSEFGPLWKQRIRRARWRAWLRRHRAVQMTDYVPDEELYHLFDAADAVIVVRQHGLSSGVPSMAMTFGRFLIAPDIGALPEYLAGTDNLLYKAGSAKSLAAAIEQAAKMDRRTAEAQNRRIADGWDWDGIIGACLEALDRVLAVPGAGSHGVEAAC
ncbi:MAG TPA: glycosyltransferase, partial [Blastocatellia bacterium]|nr:glycosyltransferase [Blastocatellia bacterium]